MKYLNLFYDGNDEEKFSLLTSDILNDKIKIINENFKNISTEIKKVKKLFEDNNSIKIENLNAKNIINDTFNSLNSTIKFLSTDSINSKEVISDEIKTSLGVITNGQVENLNSKILNSDITNVNILTIKEKLNLFENYSFTSSGVKFSNKISYPIVMNVEDNISGIISIDNNGNETSFTTDKTSTKILNKINEEFIIDSKNILLNGYTYVKELYSEKLGSKEKKIQSIYAEDIYGHYYSYDKADIAELYEVDEEYEVGTVIEIGVKTEGTISTGFKEILGVISDSYGYLLNEKLKDEKKIVAPIALAGRVKVKLSKKGERGDFVVADNFKKGFGYPVKVKTRNVFGVIIDPENDIIKVI